MLLRFNRGFIKEQFNMSNSDLRLISIVRLLCKQAQLLYEELAQVIADQQSRNLLRTLARHRSETLYAIANDATPDITAQGNPMVVPAQILQANEKVKTRLQENRPEDAIKCLVQGSKHEVAFLRQEVRNIRNETLRRRLSSFVAVLQMDFDQLQLLARNRYH